VRGLGESFESQAFSGTASFSIPIPAPAARLTPELALSYSSGGGNGVFGMGFGVAVSSVARKTSDGIPRYTSDDTFVLSDEGQLVPALLWDANKGAWVTDRRTESSGSVTWDVVAYRPRHEDLFARIEQWTRSDGIESYWRVVSAGNVVHRYGRTQSSRVFDPQQPGRGLTLR